MMEIQKRQTFDTCDRLQKHVEKCLDIIKTALTEVPAQQAQIQLKHSSEESSRSKTRKRKGIPAQPSVDRDKVMCEIADNL